MPVLRRLRRLRVPWAIVAALLAIALSALRATHLDDVIGGYTSCRGCFLVPALAHDTWLFAALFALLAAAMFATTRVVRIVFGSLAAVLLVAQAIDVELLQLFNQRFYLGDLLRFSGSAAAGWSVAHAQFFAAGGFVYGAFAATLVLVVVGLVAGARRSPRQALVLLLAAVASALFGVWGHGQSLRSVHGSFVANLVEANFPPGRERRFSAAFAAQQEARSAALPQTCEQGVATGKNVVLVTVESLSAYQSALLGGPRDWLPRLDAVARANHYFTHFYANGFTTDGGEIALFTGRVPLIPPGQEWYTIEAFGAAPDTVPGIAHRAGNQAFYFTATDLTFLGSGNWLRSLGFDAVEGNEAPFYDGMPRTQFGAADDAALFARFEHWLDERRDARPFFAALLTISTHPPFVDPRSGRIDPPGSFGYVDEQLALFYERLQQRGFFANGILVITGDHRSMTPLLGEEYRKFGERAFARVPLIVAGAVDLPPVVDAAFQQADFPASLARVMGVPYCRNAFGGVFLDRSPAPARYVVHARGDDRDRVDVYSGNAIAHYEQEGDRSHWEDASGLADPALVAAWIDTQRIRNAANRAAALR